MWQSLNNRMTGFCGSSFYDENLTWNSPNPVFSDCFEKTALVWFPCAFLWSFTLLEIYFLRHTKTCSIPFNPYNVAKLMAIALLHVTVLVDVLRYIFSDDTRYSVYIYSSVVQCLTFFLFLGLTYANIKCGVRSSAVLFMFSFLLAFCGAPRFVKKLKLNHHLHNDNSTRSDALDEDANDAKTATDSLLYAMYYTLVLFVLLLNCFADEPPSEERLWSRKKNQCPESGSSFLSKILFAWVDKFAWKGYKRPLRSDDVWELDSDMRTKHIVQTFESKWPLADARDFSDSPTSASIGIRYENENSSENDTYSKSVRLQKSKRAVAQNVSVLRVLVTTYGWFFLLGNFFRIFYVALNFATPPLLSLLLDYVTDENEFVWRGFFYAFLLFATQVLRTLIWTYSVEKMYQIGIRARTALISVIYKKALTISNGARKDFAFGEIVNLVAVDAQRFSSAIQFLSHLWFYPVEIALSFCYLWSILGPSVIAGVAVLIVFVIIAAVIVSRIQELQMKQMKYKDKRVKLINEILSGIKVLKLYAYEPNFEKYVAEIRRKEIRVLKIASYLHAVSSFIWNCSPLLVSCFTFGVYVLSDEKNVLNAQVAFVSLSLFNIMKQSMRGLPNVVKEVVQVSVALKRITKFLNSEELDPNAVAQEKRPEPVVIEDGKFSWDPSEGASPVLKNIRMKVDSAGDLVAVVGHVGSGKSSLLSAILGEMYKRSGYVNTTGRLAYVPQQAWIQNKTLRDNITLGDRPKGSFYESVLRACALIPDVKTLADGDQTVIGEKGINISGGQKQRISLARAVHSEADIYLLDDPLSAVDAHVGNHIFEQVIGPNGLLKGKVKHQSNLHGRARNKTRIFVTHNISYLPRVDKIIVLENGAISETGTYNELLKTGGYFARFLATYIKENEKSTADAEEDAERTQTVRDEDENEQISKRKHIPKSKSEKRVEKETDLVQRCTPASGGEEAQEIGNVQWKVYAYYLGSIGPLTISITVLTNLLFQVFSVASDYWLSAWSSNRNDHTSNTTDARAVPIHQYEYVLVYALLGLGQVVSIMTQTVVLSVGMLRAAEYVHNRLLTSVLRWPVSTFDKIPSGRIVNRLGSDVEVLDNAIPANVLGCLLYAATVISSLFVISFNTPLFLCVFFCIALVYYFLQRVYAATSKQLQRLDSASKSPIYSQFSDCITGAHSIRAYGLQTEFIRTYERTVDCNLRNSYANTLVNRWIGIRVDLFGAFIVLSAAIFAVLARNVISAGLVGLSVTYALQITGNLYWWTIMASEVEMNIVAVERIKEYSDIESEAPWIRPIERIPDNWPSRGAITFKDFQLRYDANSEPVLKGISFSLNGGEKVGIVGRTGAGKSSLTLGLFRIIESSGGSILIDDVDISEIGLHTLRGRLTIIPQDPALFSGTIRMNLDPMGIYSDDKIWKVLEQTNLKTYVYSLNCGLQYIVEEGGSNFSIGQRQLICLARAMLRKSKVLIMDEATAAIDFETDNLIQATIRKEFHDCTVLTIAHRLNTVLDYDRIIVLDRGHVAEFDSPSALLQSEQSIFHTMAKDAKLV